MLAGIRCNDCLPNLINMMITAILNLLKPICIQKHRMVQLLYGSSLLFQVCFHIVSNLPLLDCSPVCNPSNDHPPHIFTRHLETWFVNIYWKTPYMCSVESFAFHNSSSEQINWCKFTWHIVPRCECSNSKGHRHKSSVPANARNHSVTLFLTYLSLI